MPDLTRELKVKITSFFDGTGIKHAAEGMKDLGEKGKKAGEGIFESHRDVRELLHTLGDNAIPHVGHAFGMLAEGPLGAVVSLGMAVEVVKRYLEETNQKLDELSANASKAFGGGDYITDFVKAISQAAIESETIAEALKKASDTGPEITNRYQSEAKAIREIVDALQAKLKAQEESEIADARAAAKKTGASADVLNATEAEIHARYNSRNRAAQDAADQALQAALQRELAERLGKKPALDAAATAASTPTATAVSRQQREAELAAQEAALAKATSELNTAANDELKEKIESNKEALEFSRNAVGAGHDPLGLKKQMEDETARLESQTAEARAEAARKNIERLSQQIISDKTAEQQEKSAQADATNAATENSRRIVELQRQIQDNATAQAIKGQTLPQLESRLPGLAGASAFEKTLGVDTGAGAADFVNKFLEAQTRLMQHHGTERDSQTVMLMNQLLQVTNQTDPRTFAILQALVAGKRQHDRQLTELENQLRATSRPRQ
jgi:hypothetical protein